MNRFDGKKIKIYRPSLNGNSLDPNITSRIFADKNGDYWFTSNTALNRISWQGDSIRSYQLFETKNEYYYAFHLEQGQYLWIVINDQLFRYDLLNPPIQLIPLFEFTCYNAYAVEDEMQQVTRLLKPLVGQETGLEVTYLRASKKIKSDTLFNGQNFGHPAAKINFILMEESDMVWLGSSIGLLKVRLDAPMDFSIFTYRDRPLISTVSYMEAASWQDRYLWITTNQAGLLLFDKYREEFLRQDTTTWQNNQFKNIKSLDRIYIDAQDNLWVSSFNKGILYCNLGNQKFQQLPSIETLAAEQELSIVSIVENSQREVIYCSSQGQFFSHMNAAIQETFANLAKTRTYTTLMGHNSEFWVSNSNGLSSYEISQEGLSLQFKSRAQGYRMCQISPTSLLLLDTGNLYILKKKQAAEKGVDFKKLADLEFPSQVFFLPRIQKVLVSQDNNKLRFFDSKEQFKELPTIRNVGVVTGISQSAFGKYSWLASNTGLYKLQEGSLQLEKIPGLQNQLEQAFVDVVEDSLQRVWLSSYWGIYRYLPNLGEVQHFTQSDGLIAMKYNENTSLYGSDGKIYFGGDKGVTMIDPTDVKINKRAPQIRVNAITVNGKLYPLWEDPERPKFRYYENTLTFDLALFEFSDPALNKLKYALVKKDKDTVHVGKTNPISLNLLPPGNYQLIIEAANSDNHWTLTPTHISFRIKHPWWETWWAISLYILLFIYALYRWYRYRIQQVQKKEAEKRREAEYRQKEAEFRQKEAEYRQLVAETETAVLRLQMNPHFLFNSMNSINSYILQKDIDTASYYLTLFAKLMRQILELSEHPYIEILEEVEFLKLYLEAESMRMSRKLHFRFYIDPDIDTDEVLIPTMLLQPFVENAIWHGISPHKKEGLINIRFLLQENALLCELEDNGVGRGGAGGTSKEHKSKALDITRRRLHLLPEGKGQQAKLQIIDLKDEHGQAIGTKVEILLPLF